MQTAGGTPSPEDIEKQIIKTAVRLDPRDIEGEIYLDVETLRLSDEVPGGWSNIKDFGLAVAITWNLNEFRSWFESDAADLMPNSTSSRA